MKAQRRLGLALSWRWITSAFLIDVAVLVLASHLPVPAPPTVAWRVSVAVAAVVTIAMVVTYRGITLASTVARWVWDWSADMWDSSSDLEATLSPGCTPAIDHRRRFGRDVVGVREYQGQLVALIAVDKPVDAPRGGITARWWRRTPCRWRWSLRRCASSMCALTPSTSSRCESDTSPRPLIRPPRQR